MFLLITIDFLRILKKKGHFFFFGQVFVPFCNNRVNALDFFLCENLFQVLKKARFLLNMTILRAKPSALRIDLALLYKHILLSAFERLRVA
jgi:hypothetical protein